MKRILLFLTCVLTLFGVARAEEYTDVISKASFNNYPSSYTSNPGSFTSSNGITYLVAGMANGNNMQWNSGGSKGGLVVTGNTNSYKLKSITIQFADNNTNSVQFYSNSSAYTYTKYTDFTSTLAGTQDGTLSKENNSKSFTDGPLYWGLNSPKNAIYITSITAVWEDDDNQGYPVDYEAPFANQNYSVEVGKSLSVNVGDSYPTGLSFSTSDSKYVSINRFEITGVAEGSATISASWEADDKFNVGSTTFTVNVKEASNLPSIGDEFNLISELRDLEEGNYYVVAYTYEGNNYAMSQSIASSKIKGQSVTVKNNRTLILDDGVTVFQLGKDSNGDWTWCVTNEGQYEGMYLSWAGSTDTGYKSATTGIKVEETDNNQFSLLIGDRYLLGYNGNDFRAYTTSNLSNGVFPNIYKYEIPSNLQSANLSFSETEVTAHLNESFTPPVLTNNTGEKATYKSSDESVASVNPETGEVTLKDAGITVISAATPENDTYKAGYAEYSLIVIDPNAPTTELTIDFFGNKTTSYDLENQKDAYGFEYSAVYSANAGNIAFNKGNTNGGAGSGIVVSKINDNYIITSIDIEAGNSNMSLNVYKSSTPYPQLVKGTAPSSTNWEKVNNTPITTSQEIQINDYAFAILPNTSSSMQIKKIVVNYKKLPVNVSMHEGDDDWMQSGKVNNDDLTISMQTLQKKVMVFILDVPDGKVPHYAITDQKPLDEVVFDPTDQDMSSAYSAKNASRRAAANEDVTAPADEDFVPAQIYEQDDHPQSGSYYAVLPTGTTGNLHIRYTNAEGENPSDYVTYAYTVTYDTPTGVESVVVGEGEVIYFDLNGRRVQNPDKGIFIKVEAGKVSKVIL